MPPQIDFSYELATDRAGNGPIGNRLMATLEAVRAQGSIGTAARALDLSYRHVWGELKRWESQLGEALVVAEPGRHARLSPFAERLLWAERQAQARVAPQIEALRAELERAFALAFDARTQVLNLHASHDDALAQLRVHAAASAGLQLDIRFTGSVDAIRALNQGRCAMAGFHTLERPPVGSLAQRTYKSLLKPGQHKLIGFARRTQGLIVAPGNPLALGSLTDVAVCRARFVNRAIGTGTRVVLDELLARDGLTPDRIEGYARDEPSHAAVAHAVAAGNADAGLGLASAALAASLGFVPLVHERYHLACLKSALDEPATRALLALLASAAWRHRLGTLPGYESAASGQVQSLRTLLPWWHFRKKKA